MDFRYFRTGKTKIPLLQDKRLQRPGCEFSKGIRNAEEPLFVLSCKGNIKTMLLEKIDNELELLFMSWWESSLQMTDASGSMAESGDAEQIKVAVQLAVDIYGRSTFSSTMPVCNARN